MVKVYIKHFSDWYFENRSALLKRAEAWKNKICCWQSRKIVERLFWRLNGFIYFIRILYNYSGLELVTFLSYVGGIQNWNLARISSAITKSQCRIFAFEVLELCCFVWLQNHKKIGAHNSAVLELCCFVWLQN